MKSLVIDYDLFRDLAYGLLEKIRGNGKNYRAILCPLRGGFYLSYFMGRHLGLPMEYIQISSYDRMEQKDFNVGIRSDIGRDLFLLCDDIYDSGRTIRMIHSLYPRVSFDTVCLVSKDRDAPVLYGRCVDPSVWVNFFWETM
ncbi:MAG TPA: phosphoribosyltransferase [Spirochaetota bacterium]|nr:phosphoribosyltransferase [Spirochaetota bacterium]HPC41497.1 phosphoribosyltransferase [Spirochaetota bacterium]HPL15616.1 phosphoribosyltransferase [Spirochaetota bacterium]HQF09135.1 phosphoribosyltransferase [Spirochaetota bacterium]HQH97640.1 phosphoribosyltransferase [Spirochaetota bacterium]